MKIAICLILSAFSVYAFASELDVATKLLTETATATLESSTKIATNLKSTLFGSVDRLKSKFQSRLDSLKARGQAYSVDKVNAIKKDLTAMETKLAELNPASRVGQAGLKKFSRTLARMERRLDGRISKLAN